MRRPLAVLVVALVVVQAGFGGALVGVASAQSSGVVGVPDSNIAVDLPADSSFDVTASDLEGSVSTSAHAPTTNVVLTSGNRADSNGGVAFGGSDEVALVIEDNTYHTGRDVAVDASLIKRVVGHIPKTVTGLHSSGETWTRQVHAADGLVRFHVPHFSSNTVVFSGEVNISATPASNGSQLQYDLSDLDSVTDPNVTFTGALASEWDNVTAGPLTNGETMALDVAGTTAPTGPSANGEPVVEFRSETHNVIDDEGDGTSDTGRHLAGDSGGDVALSVSVELTPSSNLSVETMSVGVRSTSGSDYGALVDIRVASGEADTTWGEGSLVKDGWDPNWTTGTQMIQLDTTADFQANQTYEIELLTQSSDSDSSADQLEFYVDGSASSVHHIKSAGTTTKNNYYADLTLGSDAVDPALDVDGDGTAEASVSGTVSGTVTRELANLSTSDDTGTVSLSNGTLDATVRFEERTETTDPAIEVNGHTLSHTGTLADGETVNLTGNESWLQEGTNRLNVSVGATLSADSPDAAVDLSYTHEASSSISTDYIAEQYSERYNVSKTWASDRRDATLSIPFAAEVVEVRDTTTFVDGTEVTPDSVSFDGTTVTITIGDVSAGETTRVEAIGSKVWVNNGSITVLDATKPSEKLDTRIDINSWASDSYIGVGGTVDGSRIHYTYNESWDSNASVKITSAGDQHLRLPKNTGDGAFRVSTLPITASLDQGEAIFKVTDSSNRPVIDVWPGGSENNEITYKWLTPPSSGAVLESGRGTTLDSSGANPAVLVTDDDTETHKFLADSDGSTSSSGGGTFWDQQQVVRAAQNGGPLTAILVFALAGAVVLGFIALRKRAPEVLSRSPTEQPWLLAGLGLVGIIGIELLRPGTISIPIRMAAQSALPLLFVLGALLLAGGGAIVISQWRKNGVPFVGSSSSSSSSSDSAGEDSGKEDGTTIKVYD